MLHLQNIQELTPLTVQSVKHHGGCAKLPYLYVVGNPRLKVHVFAPFDDSGGRKGSFAEGGIIALEDRMKFCQGCYTGGFRMIVLAGKCGLPRNG